MRKELLVLPAVALIGLVAYIFWPTWYCSSAYHKYGFKVAVCPTGEPRQVATVWGRGLQRGGDGIVEVVLNARYTTAKADDIERQVISKFKVKLALVDAAGQETPIEAQKTEGKDDKWYREGDSIKASVKLPQVDDGDYLLRARVDSKIGETLVDMKLPLYAPARIHILTDRPLYEPGNLVQFRALALRARDLTPIDNRPGTWLVRDPNGEVILEEKAPAKEWGVVAGDFPLADDAEIGAWTVAWRSGNSEEATTFRVEPFVLPRFRVETQTDQSYYKAGDKPVLSGAVVYSSGAPVANATLELNWSASGAWPPPNEWIEGGDLPREARTGADGRFEIQLPVVPADLRGRCTLSAYVSAMDPAGDRVAASASVLLSEDSIQVSAVTELQGGLVENTNNRVYLRVTSPEGFAMGGAKVNVKRAWAPGDEGIEAELDADGVTRIQFDPGRPVNVVIPPMPVRPSVRAAAGTVTLSGLQDMVSQQRASLADQVGAEGWLKSLEPCARFVRHGSDNASVSFRVSQAGALSAHTTHGAPLNGCLARALKAKRLPGGKDRLYNASFSVQAAELPALDAAVSSAMNIPGNLQNLITNAAADARICLPTNFEGQLPWVLFWQATASSTKLELSWMRDTGSTRAMPAGAEKCINASLAGVALSDEADTSAIGLVRYNLSQPASASDSRRAQPTIMQGYELSVTATNGEDTIGSTKLRMQPGAVPNLRLRATPVLANAGDTIDLAFFRGPEYVGDLPEKIGWSHRGDFESIELEKKAKGASFPLPAGAKGWYEFSAGGARALVFVRSDDDLSVALSPGSQTYAPGETAKIAVQTKIAGQGAQAAVGLFGVDESLSQIASLRGPDDLGSIRPQITMSEQAFGALDAQALSLGRIRGAYAAEATILRVESVPAPEDVDVVLYESAETHFDPIEELTDNFYVALAELHLQTRDWERSAEAGTTMSPKKMAELWKQALKACEGRGTPAVDAYKRPLRLHWLPSDLLELTDPAQVVADATRLPEDVENWQQWVMKEKP